MSPQGFVILENNYTHAELIRAWNKNKTKQTKTGRIILDSNPLFLKTLVEIIVQNTTEGLDLAQPSHQIANDVSQDLSWPLHNSQRASLFSAMWQGEGSTFLPPQEQLIVKIYLQYFWGLLIDFIFRTVLGLRRACFQKN